MAILSKAAFSGLYIADAGTYADNTAGEITAGDLRQGFKDFFDSQTSNWYSDTSGIIGSDTTGLVGVDFNSGLAAPAWKEGRVFYDPENHAFSTYLDIPDVMLQLGQETYVRVINKTSSPISNGTVVAITGAQGNRPTVEPAIAIPEYLYHCSVIGLATHEIAVNQEGLVTVRGVVSMDTSSFGDGSGIFLSPTISGALQLEEPNAPNITVQLGWALNTTHNGKVLVNPTHNCMLEQLSDVNGSTAKNGSLLLYREANGFWDKSQEITAPSGIILHSGVWRDNVSDFTRAATAGATAPIFASWQGGLYAYSFPSNADRELFIAFHIDHDWMPGTDLYPHVHWAPSTATGSGTYVQWGFEYTVAKGHQQEAFPTPTTVYASGMVLGIQNMHHITETNDAAVIPGSGIEIDSVIYMRVFRDTSIGNHYTGAVWGLFADLHYLSDREGTVNKAPNFYI